MNRLDRELAVRFAVTAAQAARQDLSAIRAKDAGQTQKDIWHDYGVLMAHVAILAEKIDGLTGGAA